MKVSRFPDSDPLFKKARADAQRDFHRAYAATRLADRRKEERAKAEPIYRGDKRKHLVSEIIDVLRDWRDSPFQNEADTVAGLRQGLCLKGYDWPRSAGEAGAVVAEAFKHIGNKRPSWDEGQWQYATPRENCQWCAKLIEGEDITRGQRFCSPECAQQCAGSSRVGRQEKEECGGSVRLQSDHQKEQAGSELRDMRLQCSIR